MLPSLRVSLILCCLAITAAAQPRSASYRGFWVDTFNTALNNHSDVLAVLDAAKAASANVLFVQVRRRGDCWCLNSLEPLPDFTSIEPGFDPLLDIIAEAHAAGMEVHAFVIMAAIWNKNPTFEATATLGRPTNPNHVFNLHGGYDLPMRQIVPGPDNWLTRSLLPDGTAGITFQGHRFGSDFWLDFGHPDAAAYTVEVLMHLLRSYDIDGLHLDRIRYPEFSASGQTPATGTNVGYNATSVARYQSYYGIPEGSAPPSPADPDWSTWRRDQVSDLVRRVYLNAFAIRPRIKISAALIAFGSGPVLEPNWLAAEAYWRVYQDWRAWTEEGILDIAMPMNYKREDVPAQALWYDQWNEWTKNHQYNRAAMIGPAVFLNSIEGSLRQTRRALDPSASGKEVIGVTFYSLANPDAALNSNPFSIPAGRNTPARGGAEFASALTTGKSRDGASQYEDTSVAVFANSATVPTLEWKVSPKVGHLMGFAKRADGVPLDTATVFCYTPDGSVQRVTWTDGGGFFGVIDLPPGTYVVDVQLRGDRLFAANVQVGVGAVATVFPLTFAAQ